MTAIPITDASAQVRAFVARARSARARSYALRAALLAGVPLLFLMLLCALLHAGLPGRLWPWAAPLLALAAACGWLGGRLAPDLGLLRGLPPSLGVHPGLLADELATWLESQRTARGSEPMVDWLGRDLASELGVVPARSLRRLGRRALGAVRWLLPLCALLLLVLLLRALLPDLPGMLGGGSGGGSGPGAGGSGAGTGAPKPAETGPGPGAAPQLPPPPEPEPEPPPEPERPAVPEPPAPLLDVPVHEQFAVPVFVGDGPSRRELARVVRLEQGSGAGQAGGQGGAAAAPRAPDPAFPDPEEFKRAAERALRSRHVPAEEQPMVRRFFELLGRERR